MRLLSPFRRWRVELYQRAVHLQQIPDPNCRYCDGAGGWWDGGYDGESPEPVTCHCTDRLRHYRIPLWRRTTADYATEAPF
ncbi:hypothetical protein ACFC09_36305 [Streptomyces sp. NPDC056161]|uniref:hypothetical protein n=1 Tax=Streptomyces sp. NPDC056161 TaxID=3345732 RepID=UPI0035E0C6CB